MLPLQPRVERRSLSFLSNPTNYQSKNAYKKGLPTCPLKLRLVRVKLDGEIEVLITNLMDEQAIPASEFKELYHLRWGAEENYKRLKQ